MIVGNDEKVVFDDKGNPAFSAPSKDTVSVIDITSRGAPRILRGTTDVREFYFYLGLSEAGHRKSFREIRFYKRRKCWVFRWRAERDGRFGRHAVRPRRNRGHDGARASVRWNTHGQPH